MCVTRVCDIAKEFCEVYEGVSDCARDAYMVNPPIREQDSNSRKVLSSTSILGRLYLSTKDKVFIHSGGV